MITAWGGACENEETPLQAAKREVHEETNLRPTENDFEFFGDYPRDYKVDDKQVVNHVFLLRNVDESGLLIFEGQDWVQVDPRVDAKNKLYTALTTEVITDYSSKATL